MSAALRLPPPKAPLAPLRGVRLALICVVGQAYLTFVVHPKHAAGLFCFLALLPLLLLLGACLPRDAQPDLARDALDDARREREADPDGERETPDWLFHWIKNFVDEDAPDGRRKRDGK